MGGIPAVLRMLFISLIPAALPEDRHRQNPGSLARRNSGSGDGEAPALEEPAECRSMAACDDAEQDQEGYCPRGKPGGGCGRQAAFVLQQKKTGTPYRSPEEYHRRASVK